MGPENGPDQPSVSVPPGRRRGEQRHVDRHVLLGQPPGEVGAEQGHLALGEVDRAGRPVDHDECQRQNGVDGAVADPVEQPVKEDLHQNPR